MGCQRNKENLQVSGMGRIGGTHGVFCMIGNHYSPLVFLRFHAVKKSPARLRQRPTVWAPSRVLDASCNLVASPSNVPVLQSGFVSSHEVRAC